MARRGYASGFRGRRATSQISAVSKDTGGIVLDREGVGGGCGLANMQHRRGRYREPCRRRRHLNYCVPTDAAISATEDRAVVERDVYCAGHDRMEDGRHRVLH